MILNPQNIIYVYNSGDEDSVRLAQEYALIRQVPSSNLLGLDVFTKKEEQGSIISAICAF